MSPTGYALLCVFAIFLAFILIPMLPAILIYRLFPNEKIGATGLLGKLNINTTGAFAGYLIILLVMIPVVRYFQLVPDFKTLKKEFSTDRTSPWTVYSKVAFLENGNISEEITNDDVKKQLDIKLDPDAIEKSLNSIIFLTNYSKKVYEPWVKFEYPGYKPFTKKLVDPASSDSKDSTIKFYPGDKEIHLGVITLKKIVQEFKPDSTKAVIKVADNSISQEKGPPINQ